MIDRLDVNAVVLQIMRVQQAHFSFFMPAFFLLHASNSGPFCLKKGKKGKKKEGNPLLNLASGTFRLWYFSASLEVRSSCSRKIFHLPLFPIR
jgi:hypothetical protein